MKKTLKEELNDMMIGETKFYPISKKNNINNKMHEIQRESTKEFTKRNLVRQGQTIVIRTV